MSRQSGRRQIKKSYVVLGDGQTEYYYLKHLKKIKEYRFILRPSLFDSITIETVEELIDEYLSGDCDQIIYFTDYDTIVNQNKLTEFKKLKQKYKNIKEVFICETMPCIEFWFLLHFGLTTWEYRNAKEVTKDLIKCFNNYSKEIKFLEKQKWVSDLCSKGKLERAIKNANLIMKEKLASNVGSHFPFTNVHIAIEWFEKQKNNSN
jgi:hypothetical protein